MTLRAARDAAPATWIHASLHPAGRDVGSIIPDGFDAYARVFHPAYKDDAEGVERPVCWRDIAAAHGRTLAEEMQGLDIGCTPSKFGPGGEEDPLWESAPTFGSPPLGVTERLVTTLRAHTTTPERCWFGLWEGRRGRRAFVNRAPRFGDKFRMYYLLEGAVDDATMDLFDPGAGTTITLQPFNLDQPSIYTIFGVEPPTPPASVPKRPAAPTRREHVDGSNLWWPDDHAWCVASEIDFRWTYVGGSRACIDELLADPALEAVPTHPTECNLMRTS